MGYTYKHQLLQKLKRFVWIYNTTGYQQSPSTPTGTLYRHRLLHSRTLAGHIPQHVPQYSDWHILQTPTVTYTPGISWTYNTIGHPLSPSNTLQCMYCYLYSSTLFDMLNRPLNATYTQYPDCHTLQNFNCYIHKNSYWDT